MSNERKLLTEFVSDVKASGRKGSKYLIEGIFIQANVKNANDRYYPRSIMDKSVGQYIEEQVLAGRAVGELSHPETVKVNLDRVSHKIVDLEWDGDDLHGRAEILDTPCGEIVKRLIDAGIMLGVSSRGVGSVEERDGCSYVTDDFELRAIDIVQNPSAPDSFVTAEVIAEEAGLGARQRRGPAEQRRIVEEAKDEARLDLLRGAAEACRAAMKKYKGDFPLLQGIQT